MLNRRNEKGSAMGLVVACSLVLGAVVVAYYQISLSMQGSQEVRNAVDSGSLNVGKQAPTLKVSTESQDERQFDDVLDSKQQIGLTNINRVWGKAMLINMNVEAMGGAGRQHADAIFNAANSVSERLSDRLNNQKNLHGFFNEFAQSNSARMLGPTSTVKAMPGQSWQTSLLDRGAETNITINAQQLPQAGRFADVSTTASGKTYIAGYKPIKVLDKSFIFVPFKHDEKPHLVSGSYFNSNTNKANPVGTSKPVPNSFSTFGQSFNNARYGQTAIAYVQANPQRPFNLAIPHAFVRITLGDHKARIAVNQNYSEEDYTPGVVEPRVKSSNAGSGTLTTTTFVGLEYIPPTLYKAIIALPGEHQRVMQLLLQRMREIKQDCTEGEMIAALNACPIIPNTREYYLFPVYAGDNTNPRIFAAPVTNAKSSAPWLQTTAQPEGAPRVVAQEFSVNGPDFIIPILAGAGIPVYGPQIVTQEGTQKWSAGSGFDGCLGELEIERSVNVVSTGVVITP